MASVTTEEIPDGSYELRVFPGDDVYGEADISAVMVLRNLGGGVCEASLAYGSLTNEVNILIGMKVRELGFRHLQFRVLKGKRASRWAEKVGEDDHFQYYTVDIEKFAEAVGRGSNGDVI